ncbi:uncharacterized protein F4812DRAFT_459607 [Daldinia caldariorum]|uniref:uncharacterized protein n=1 Tax=Daldinia caldariorum TaxID=326644 RepID=UPI0020083F3D|nr:uncharacterized protein F4812DRAFT_459607 [Daldinia caldariorum]KAI1467501.1 hypothetical protein F4812DRAFT_459607 [Daldinia caldariorum]
MDGGSKNNGKGKQKKRPPPHQYRHCGQGQERRWTCYRGYSCTELDSDDPNHYLIATEVRRQAQEAPEEQADDPTSRTRKTKYPQTFKNKEELQGLQSKEKGKEYPVVPGRGQNWDQMSKGRSGPGRVIFNPDPETRNQFDMLYHSSKTPGKNCQDFKFANYKSFKPSSKRKEDASQAFPSKQDSNNQRSSETMSSKKKSSKNSSKDDSSLENSSSEDSSSDDSSDEDAKSSD